MGDKRILSKFHQARVCRYIPGEDHRERHHRRHKEAVRGLETVQVWCDYRGVVMTVKPIHGSDYCLWDFRFPDKFAQWRPWLGKMSLKKRLREREVHLIKVHEVQQLLVALEDWLTEPASRL